MHLDRRLLAALVVLLGGMYKFWPTGLVTGLELLWGPDSGGIYLSGKYGCTNPKTEAIRDYVAQEQPLALASLSADMPRSEVHRPNQEHRLSI